ncbi:PAS domain-containing protein [Vibrio sp. SA48]
MVDVSLQNRQMWWSFNINNSDFDCDKHMFATLFPDDSVPQKINDILNYMTQDIAAHAKAIFTNVLKTGKSNQFSCCLVTQSYAFCFVSFSVSLEQRGILSGLVAILLCEKTRVSVAGLFQSIINNQHHGIVISDSQTRILACNTLFEKQTGYLQQELLGCKTNIFNAGKHSPSFLNKCGVILKPKVIGMVWF